MDSTHAYASAHVPVVTLAGTEPRGIRQTGVAIAAGKAYTGRIVIAGDAGAAVSVSLISGEGTAGRRTVRLADARSPDRAGDREGGPAPS